MKHCIYISKMPVKDYKNLCFKADIFDNKTSLSVGKILLGKVTIKFYCHPLSFYFRTYKSCFSHTSFEIVNTFFPTLSFEIFPRPKFGRNIWKKHLVNVPIFHMNNFIEFNSYFSPRISTSTFFHQRRFSKKVKNLKN